MTFLELRDKLNSLPEEALSSEASFSFVDSDTGNRETIQIKDVVLGRIQRKDFYKEYAMFDMARIISFYGSIEA